MLQITPKKGNCQKVTKPKQVPTIKAIGSFGKQIFLSKDNNLNKFEPNFNLLGDLTWNDPTRKSF